MALYANPTNLLAWFDAQEIAQLATPKRYPVVDAVLLELTASSGDRSAYTQPEIEAADAALARIDGAISNADAEIDSYIGGRYTLPLDAALVSGSGLPRKCGDIARYLLMDDRATDEATSRYDNTLRWLRDVARGVATLGQQDTGTATPQGRVVTQQGESNHDWDAY